MLVLVCNAGSTSLKFKLYDMPCGRVLAAARLERIGVRDDGVFSYVRASDGAKVFLEKQDIPDYITGVEMFLGRLTSESAGVVSDVGEIGRVGFKATLSKDHNGVYELDAGALQGMRDWIAMAQLHNKAYLDVVDAMRRVLPEQLFIGCFETAFHATIPMERRIFGVPYAWYEQYGVQRLGYHGASHGYIADVLSAEQPRYRALSCHLGGSCSVCAILDGKSVDTSFGMSLQSGLLHANRSGDLDGDLYVFLRDQGLTDREIRAGMLENGGIKGISGVSSDLRYVEEAARAGNERAQLAIDAFVAGIVHYLGAFYVDLGGCDVIVFTAGIGENDALIRRMVCEKLGAVGVKLDEEKNQACRGDQVISAPDSAIAVRVIPTDEEKGIARRTYEFRPSAGQGGADAIPSGSL